MHEYANPILDEDWPDPDVIRVGERFIMVASSFNRSPGLPVLVSENLVDWTIASHALARLVPEAHFALPRHGGGVWAPSIRWHNGLLRIYYPDPDHGVFVVTASDPAGPWSPPRLVLAGEGVIDPCVLWDDDGSVYLVHAWARSRSGTKNRLTLRRLGPGADAVVGAPLLLIDGDDLPGYSTLEGPKIYKRDGWYWIFAPAGGVETGWQSVFRSRAITGPYEHRIVLAQGDTPVNGPHQGAWVTDPDGGDWFVHFQHRGPAGRVTHLQPLTWDDEGWPLIGAPGRYGTPVLTHAAPLGSRVANREPEGSDSFRGPDLGPKWHWQANPGADWLRRVGGGRLELTRVAAAVQNLRFQPNVLAQVLPGRPSQISTSVYPGDSSGAGRAGLVLLGERYAWLGLRTGEDGSVDLVLGSGGDGIDESITRLTACPADAAVELRVRVDAEFDARFAWRFSADQPWQEAAEPIPARAGTWIGAEVGLFAAAAQQPGAGHVSFGAVVVEVEPRSVQS